MDICLTSSHAPCGHGGKVVKKLRDGESQRGRLKYIDWTVAVEAFMSRHGNEMFSVLRKSCVLQILVLYLLES